MVRIGAPRLGIAALLLCVSVSQAERYSVPLLVPSGASGEPQGALRILNGTGESGSVEIYAIDDAGTRSGPAIFTLNAWTAVEFTAADLRSGNAMLGLAGGIGEDMGDARLELVTDLHIVPLALVRAADGTLSAMHDTVRGEANDESGRFTYGVPIFNPSTDATQVSRLRLINPGDAAASVTIAGRDDAGATASGGTVELTLASGAARTLTAQQLESGDTGLTGRLGAGVGKWRLTVSSDRSIQVVNAVSSASGHTNNLSTTALAGPAPADHDAFNERFLGSAIGFRTDIGDFTFAPGAGDTFTVTAERDGVTTSRTGRYGYAALGADAGWVTQSYDDALRCEANLYFARATGGWFASFCSDPGDPDGYWVAGNWSVPDDAGGGQGGSGPDTPPDGGGGVAPGSLGVCELGMSLSRGQSCTYPETTDEFSVNVRGRASFLGRLAGIRIRIDNQTINGRAYDLLASHQGDGVWRIDRIEARTEPPSVGGTGGTSPRFTAGARPSDLTYTAGTAIDTLTLPEASGGNGSLGYSLTPEVPGLSFDATTRQLSGTPARAGNYEMTYTATDEDGDTDTLAFAVAVEEAPAAGDFGLESANGHPRAIVFANGRFHVVDSSEGKVYAYTATGKRDSTADFNLDGDNSLPTGIAFADGRFLVLDSIDDKVYGHTVSGQRDSAGDFDLDGDYWIRARIVFAGGRFHVVDWLNNKVHAYTASGERESEADFDLDEDNGNASGVTFANGRFHVLDNGKNKVFAYTASGHRDSDTDFDLATENGDPSGIAFANGQFHVADIIDDKVYAYTASGRRAASGDSRGVHADLAVASPTTSDSAPAPGGSFALSVTVRNDGGAEAPATTLRYYRSADSVIGTGDMEVGANEVDRLAASGTSSQSVRLTAPFSVGTVYYGACVDAAANESDTANNCSSALSVRVTASSGTGPPSPPATPSPPPLPLNWRLVREDTENSVNIRFSWDPSPGATSYNVQRCHIAPAHCMWSSYWNTIASGITETFWLDTTILSLPGRSREDIGHLEYSVHACNSAGCSQTSVPHPGIE